MGPSMNHHGPQKTTVSDRERNELDISRMCAVTRSTGIMSLDILHTTVRSCYYMENGTQTLRN